ncbi:MAG TPA: hypothetical protein IAA26_11235 [Candidatus Blautia faecipullorum]|nr:hypothetical protein [Candidatus Blautia faecipullorum]
MNFKEVYFGLWSEAWQLHKRFYNNDGSDQAWQEIVDTSSEVAEKHKDSGHYEFIKDLILLVLAELERQDKRKRKEQG